LLLLTANAELQAQLNVAIDSLNAIPGKRLNVMNVGAGGERHFEIRDNEDHTVLSAKQQQFRNEPASRAALDAYWSPDGKLVAISIALGDSAVDTCVYALRGEPFVPVGLNAFQPGHKVAPIGWRNPRDLVVSVDGPFPPAGHRPVFGRTCIYRFHPEKLRFEKVYQSRAKRLESAKLLACFKSPEEKDPDLQRQIEKLRRMFPADEHPEWRSYVRRRDCLVLLTGRKAEATVASLMASPKIDSGVTMGQFDLGELVFVDEHGRAKWKIDTTDAPKAWVIRADNDARFIWNRDDSTEHEMHLAREFYRQVLPELRRLAPAEIEHEESFFPKGWLENRIETYWHEAR
jgi:hypothetical protein